ncbi:SAM-dependent methyltransferase [Paenibacillus sambharensis]|uniref:SAM-dependent methyltransferase n=1 Tax=Paenibacillus sambharensis TaxID=1803190 RepID=A0A2W1L131_9BACL|nr:class I SAM-dependent methyltransferase [Paenibacillus sambharensis]PZD93638.1 SAM-dependent methyltransferase [Paenibacillus sambharensis]
MIVTTSEKPVQQIEERARMLADELSGRYVPRKDSTLVKLRQRYHDDQLLVVTADELRYYEDEGTPLHFHPSMAFVRVKRLRKGEIDPLLAVSGCTPGDSVVDCTAGLASDSIVFAYGVGPAGHVTALESEQLLYTIIREGLQHYITGLKDVDDALRRIEVVREEHLRYLSGLPDNSVDIIYFDPMFRDPIAASASLRPLRGLANHQALTEQAVAEAVRAARKSVVLKEMAKSGEFERLGFERQRYGTAKTAYGVIRI